MISSGVKTAWLLAWRGSRPWLAGCVFISVLAGLVPPIQLKLLGVIVQAFASGSGVQGIRLVVSAFSLGALMGMMAGLNSLRNFAVARLQRSLELFALSSLLAAVARLSPAQMEDAETRDGLEIARSTATERMGAFWDSLLTWLGQLVTTVGVVVVLAEISPLVAFLLVLAAVPPLFFSRWIFRTWDTASQLVGAESRRSSSLLTFLWNPAGFIDSRLSEAGAVFRERVQTAVKARWKAQLRGVDVESISAALSGALTAVLLGTAILFLTTRDISPGQIAIILGSLTTLSVLMSVFFGGSSLFSELPYLARLGAALEEAAGQPVGEELHLREPISEIVVSSVEFTYPTRSQAALFAATFTFEKGNVYAITGDNGSGKSTLVKLILGIYEPVSGSILLNGRDCAAEGIDARVGRFAFMGQDLPRPPVSLWDYLTSGRRVDAQSVSRALHRAGVADFVSHLDEGLETVIGAEFEHGTQFSGGQWQRIALARLYLSESSVWILDEPTAALDVRGERDVVDWVRENLGQRIAIIVSHRLTTIAHADQVLRVSNGKLVIVDALDAGHSG